jgi:hypothetical protein
MDEQPAKYGNVHIERENKKEKTHQHKREEHITQERKRPSVERKVKHTRIERDVIYHLTVLFQSVTFQLILFYYLGYVFVCFTPSNY